MKYSCFQDMIETLLKEGIEVTMKYNKEKSQVYYEQLLWCAKNCLNGRDFMNLSWCELLQKEGLLKVNKVTTTTYS